MAGYLGAIPVPQATQHRESFTATSGQTTFNTAGYTVGFLDVYLNGSHLSPADFTATNGSDVVLASGASADDVCDIISYTAFEVADQTFTGTTTLDGAVVINESSADVDFRVESNGNANMLFVDGGNDNVGIGVVPTNVSGYTCLDIGAGSTGSFIELDSANGMYHRFINNNGQLIIQADQGNSVADSAIIHYVDGSEAMRIDSSGNVGIGASSVTQKLDIEASAVNTGILLHNTNTTSGASVPIFLASESGGSTTNVSIDNTGSGHLSFRTGATTKNSFGSERLRIDSSGAVTMPAQPAFQAVPASNQSNLPINAITTVVFGTERFDQNADFASNTFTAPVTGKYQLNASIYFNTVDIDTVYLELRIVTSNRTYIAIFGTSSFDADNYLSLTQSQLVDMDAGDTALIQIGVPNSGTAQADITPNSSFGGYLVA